MGATNELLPIAAIYSNPQQLAITITGIATLGATAAKAFDIVSITDRGIRMRSGRPMLKEEFRGLGEEELAALPAEVLESGIYDIRGGQGKRIVWLLPFIDRVVKVNITDRSDPLPEFEIESSDGYQHKVNGLVTWHVRPDGDNPHKSRFQVNNEKDNKDKDKDLELKQTVIGICKAGLGRALSGRSAEELVKLNYDKSILDVNQKTKDECHEELLEYGVALKKLRLDPIARIGEEVLGNYIQGGNDPVKAGLVAGRVLGEKDSRRLRVVPEEPNTSA